MLTPSDNVIDRVMTAIGLWFIPVSDSDGKRDSKSR